MKSRPDNKSARSPNSIEFDLRPTFSLDYIRPVQTEKLPPCGSNCPSGGSVREWIGLVAQRDKLGLTKVEAYRRAWETIVDKNPFPATMGRICPHPCETSCNRLEKDGAVAVSELERFLGDWGLENNLTLKSIDNAIQTESVAVIGAGPAGLSFAYQMARRGYSVTVFDNHAHPGGMLRFGIPDYRLPPLILDGEIDRIRALGVDFKMGTQIGADVTVHSLRAKYDVLFVGVGAQIGRSLRIPGENGTGVYSGTDYLHRFNTGSIVDLGKNVIVVGGGNTAIDAARAARRQGSEVSIIYRRTRNEMPAIEHEIDEALEEGVNIHFLSTPVQINRSSTGVESVLIQKMELGAPDDSGRRRPMPVEGAIEEITASSVLVAISQEPDWTNLDEVNHDGAWLMTPEDGSLDDYTYAGGDVRGLGVASLAIGHGRVAAETAHARLRGLPSPLNSGTTSKTVKPAVKLGFYDDKERVQASHVDVEDRLQHPELEVSLAISEDQFLEESSRCLSCENCFGCQHCWMYCNGGGFIEVDDPSPGHYFKLDLSVCEGCGKCIDVCPSGFLGPR